MKLPNCKKVNFDQLINTGKFDINCRSVNIKRCFEILCSYERYLSSSAGERSGRHLNACDASAVLNQMSYHVN